MQYRIVSKVVLTVIDNAANFVKAFKEYASDASGEQDISSQDVNDENDNLTFTNVDHIIREGDDDQEVSLPPHQRCAAHTLNLVATSDTEAANRDAQYKKLSRSTFAKCSALWNKASRSTSFADVVRDKLQTCLVIPNATRWNSFFNAVDKLKDLLAKSPDDVARTGF